jgi:transcriptional regulator with XRE-family HTH domain
VKQKSPTAFQKQVGLRVRELRIAKGISQEAFADSCGLHRTHMSLLERGRINITINTLHQIVSMLNIRMADFFSGMKK